jgi:hypothetical protein
MNTAACKRITIGLLIVVVANLAALRPLRAIPRKHKPKEASLANDPTDRLYQLLDQSMDGKLDLYLLGDTYTDPSSSGDQYQRILRVVYNKDLYFGRFTIHIRSVAKMSPVQLATYTPRQIYHYAANDTAEFEKITPGLFGKTGDLYLVASDDHPPASAPITRGVQQEYENLVVNYILPSVQKQAAAKQ